MVKKILTKIISKNALTKMSKLVLARQQIVGRLLKIMKRHIGTDSKISRMNLFYKIYKVKENELNELQVYILWDMLKKAMHYCRQRTKCQIVSKTFKVSRYSTQGGVYYYWVADCSSDAKVYEDNIKKNIKAMYKAVKRVNDSVKQRWYNLDWEKTFKQKKLN